MHPMIRLIGEILSIVLVLLARISHGAEPCQIYCASPLLRKIQSEGIFNDSKTFVDMPSKLPLSKVLENFELIKANLSSREVLADFVSQHFHDAGYELVPKRPMDWRKNPSFLSGIRDPSLRDFASNVHMKWKLLARRFDHSRLCPGCIASSIPQKHTFLVPGGRFREFYYWDTYWIVEGLLVSEMYTTVRGMLLNMADMIHTYGFIPNGARTYYLNRSQPPLLVQMVWRYANTTGDTRFVSDILPALDKEYNYWMTKKTVLLGHDGDHDVLNVYRVDTDQPRPESYMEDLDLGQAFDDADRRKEFYQSIAAGAESGWDFSTRWLRDTSLGISSIDTSHIIPVDLNAILYTNERLLAKFHGENPDTAHAYTQAAQRRRLAIRRYLWHEDDDLWYDYNTTSNRPRRHHNTTSFYLSQLAPLWAGAFEVVGSDFAPAHLDRILKRHAHAVFTGHPGGIPASRRPSTGAGLSQDHQQWDYPNAWAPLQYNAWQVYQRLCDAGLPYHRDAEFLVQRWITTTYCGWRRTGQLFEKYNVARVGYSGNGGEYVPQVGFGWTNGVVLFFLHRYGHVLKAPIDCKNVTFEYTEGPTHRDRLLWEAPEQDYIPSICPHVTWRRIFSIGIMLMLLCRFSKSMHLDRRCQTTSDKRHA